MAGLRAARDAQGGANRAAIAANNSANTVSIASIHLAAQAAAIRCAIIGIGVRAA
ncbi:MAG: hypothetical protein ABSG18_23645 [Steroidobacteraceae bacterium]